MKPLSLVLVMLIFGLLHSKAQTYHPFPIKNTIWTEMFYYPYPDYKYEFHCFALKTNDTLINNKVYHKLYHSKDTIFNENKLCGALREENKKIYYYSIVPINYTYTSIIKDTEVLLYDFSLNVGDTIRRDLFRISHPNMLVLKKIDSLKIDKDYRKVYHFDTPSVDTLNLPLNSFMTWIEGIGYLRGLLLSTGDLPTNGLWNDIICFKQENKVLYHFDQKYSDCYYIKPDAVENIKGQENVKIWPNPVLNKLHSVFFTGKFNQILLINMLGATIRKYNVINLSSIEINREDIPPGIYLLAFIGKNNDNYIKKIIFE